MPHEISKTNYLWKMLADSYILSKGKKWTMTHHTEIPYLLFT